MSNRLYPLLRLRCRSELRRQGRNYSEINSIMDGWDDAVVPIAVAMLPPEHADEFGALGDGTIIQAIIEFLKSPAGQMLIQLILSLLMGL